MLKRMPTHTGDDTHASCVIAGDYIFLAHHAGGFEQENLVYQMRKTFERMRQTLESAGAGLDDMVQIHLYLKNIKDLGEAAEVFREYFKNGVPARMTSTTQFFDDECLCMMDGVAYKPQK